MAEVAALPAADLAAHISRPVMLFQAFEITRLSESLVAVVRQRQCETHVLNNMASKLTCTPSTGMFVKTMTGSSLPSRLDVAGRGGCLSLGRHFFMTGRNMYHTGSTRNGGVQYFTVELGWSYTCRHAFAKFSRD